MHSGGSAQARREVAKKKGRMQEVNEVGRRGAKQQKESTEKGEKWFRNKLEEILSFFF